MVVEVLLDAMMPLMDLRLLQQMIRVEDLPLTMTWVFHPSKLALSVSPCVLLSLTKVWTELMMIQNVTEAFRPFPIWQAEVHYLRDLHSP